MMIALVLPMRLCERDEHETTQRAICQANELAMTYMNVKNNAKIESSKRSYRMRVIMASPLSRQNKTCNPYRQSYRPNACLKYPSQAYVS